MEWFVYYGDRQNWKGCCQRLVQLSESMVISGWAATCGHQWPFGCLWSRFPPEAMLVSGPGLPPRAISIFLVLL